MRKCGESNLDVIRIREEAEECQAKQRRWFAYTAAKGPQDWQNENAPLNEFRIVSARAADGAEGAKAGDKVRERRKPTIAALVDAGRLTLEQEWAAKEIYWIFSAFGRVLFAGRAEDMAPKVSCSRFIPPIERLLDGELRKWEKNYKPWADWAGKIAAGNGVNLLELTIEIVVDERSLREMDRRCLRRDGSASAALRNSLSEYCRIAGQNFN